MISVKTAATKTVSAVHEQQDKEELSPRILELRRKIHDSSYLDNAIARIAQVVSRNLVEDEDMFFLRTSGT